MLCLSLSLLEPLVAKITLGEAFGIGLGAFVSDQRNSISVGGQVTTFRIAIIKDIPEFLQVTNQQDFSPIATKGEHAGDCAVTVFIKARMFFGNTDHIL